MNDFHKTVYIIAKRHFGISQRELAERCGIGEVTLSRYLTLQRDFSLDAFMAMCRVLDLRVHRMYWLYCNVRGLND